MSDTTDAIRDMLTTFATSLRRQGEIPFDEAFANAIDDVVALLPPKQPLWTQVVGIPVELAPALPEGVEYDPAKPDRIVVDGEACEIRTWNRDLAEAWVSCGTDILYVNGGTSRCSTLKDTQYPNRWPIPHARLPEIAAWVRKVRAESNPALPPHMVRLPGGAVLEVLQNGNPDFCFLAVPGKQPPVWIRHRYGPRASNAERSDMVVADRPSWLTDAMLADVQKWLDERGIKLEGQR